MQTQKWSIIDFQESIKNASAKAKIEMPPDNLPYHISSNILLVDNFFKKQLLDLPFVIEYQEINGFLNFKMDKNIIKHITYKKISKRINIEFCSPNPTGPMHLAHCRGTIIGNTIVNLFRFAGAEILSEMYINDLGMQMDKFVESVKYWKFGEPYVLHYKGEYVKELSCKLHEINKEIVIHAQLESILNTLKSMDIHHDTIVRESSLYSQIEFVKTELQKMNLLHKAYLKHQKQQGQHLLIKTSQLGHHEDSVFQREEGQYTYFAFDIAYHLNKKERGYENQICILGEDHFSHMNKLPKVLELLGINLKIVTFSAVHLVDKGEKVSMSKRNGKFLTIDDFLKQYSIDEITCMVLEQKLEKVLQFDENKKSNNIFYFQYVFERTKDMVEISDEVDLNLLNTIMEDRIFTFLIHFDRFVHMALFQLNIHKFFDFSLKFAQCVCEYFQKDLTINNNPSKEQIYLLWQCKKTFEYIRQIFNFHF